MVPSNPNYKCSYDILASTLCHCKHIPAYRFCFHVPGSFDPYSTGCVCHDKSISFGEIRRKLEKGIF